MIMEMYSIKDRLNGFIPPIPLANEETAQRWFKEMITENITMKLSPNDFGLWYLGKWNTETGIFENDVREVVYVQNGLQ